MFTLDVLANDHGDLPPELAARIQSALEALDWQDDARLPLPVQRAHDERPERMLELAEAVVGGDPSWDEAEAEVDRFRTDLLRLASTIE